MSGWAASRRAGSAGWWALPVVLVAAFTVQFDLYVANVALPVLQRDLHASPAALELVVGGYAFSYAAGLVTGGRLGDLFGHRRVFLVGMAAFGAASLLCGLAPSPAALVGARLVQGLAAAALVPQVLALITAGLPAHRRRRAMAWFGVTLGAGAVTGQVLGGLLLDLDVAGFGWRAIFFVNVPIAAATVVAGQRVLSTGRSERRPRLDPLGVVLVSGSLALALFPLTVGRAESWPLWTWAAMAASVPTMAAALAWERHLSKGGGQPLLDLTLFGDRAFRDGLAVNVASFASFFAFVLTLTLVLQDGLGLSPLAAGLTFAPMSSSFAVSSMIAKRFVARHASRVITVGSAISAVGMVALVAVLRLRGGAVSVPELLGPIMAVGCGNGTYVPALIGAVLGDIPDERAGVAAGLLTTAQQFAGAAGIAAFGAVFFEALGTRRGPAGYASAMEWAVAGPVVLALVAVAVSVRLPRHAVASAPSPVTG